MQKKLTKQDIKIAGNYWAMSFDRPDKVVPLRPVRQSIKRSGSSGEPSEHQIQRAVIAWWNKWCHEFGCVQEELLAIPNGGARDAVTASKLKAEGVRRGVPDLFVPVPRDGYYGLWIEMKKRGGRLSEEQVQTIERLRQRGYIAVTCYSVEEAKTAIKIYFGVDK